MNDKIEAPFNPANFLDYHKNKEVIVALKWNNLKYLGTLDSFDRFHNLLLKNVTEISENEQQSTILSEMFIRCNNVKYIQQKNEKKEEKNE